MLPKFARISVALRAIPVTLAVSARVGMRRRQFLAALGGAAVLAPSQLRAQQAGRTYRVGVFVTVNNPAMNAAYHAFIAEMRAQGFVEGQNLVLMQRPTDQPSAALAADVAEAVRLKIDAIVTSTQPALQAAAGTGIPVVISANN
jgi:putative tryptophan/tyrosine transport system substrate-binding protein